MERIRQSNRIVVFILLTATLFGLVIVLIVQLQNNAAKRDIPQPIHSIYVSGKKVEVPKIMTINGNAVSLEEYRFYFLSQKSKMEAGNPNYFQSGNVSEKNSNLKVNTLNALLNDYAIRQLAAEKKLPITTAEKRQIENDMENQIRTLGGKRQYYQALTQANMTDDLYRMQWITTCSYENLCQYYSGAGDANESTTPCAAGNQLYTSNHSPQQTNIQNQNVDSKKQENLGKQLLQKDLSATIDQMKIVYAPEYNLINVDTLK